MRTIYFHGLSKGLRNSLKVTDYEEKTSEEDLKVQWQKVM